MIAHPPLCYGYSRVSHYTDEPFFGPKAQRDKIDQYYKTTVATRPEAPEWGDIFFDEQLAKGPFAERAAGRELIKRLRKGDHVVIAHSGRAFRSTKDLIVTLQMWQQRGVTSHFLDPPFKDVSAPEVYSAIVQVAEFVRRLNGQRTKEELGWKICSALPCNGASPLGWRKVGEKRQSRFVVCQEERDTAIEVEALYRKFGSRNKTYRFLRHEKRLWRGAPYSEKIVRRIVQAVRSNFALSGGSLVAGKPSIEQFC